MNSITITGINELTDAILQANANDEIGCIIITGAGDSFCAGMDLSGGEKTFDINELADIGPIDWNDPHFRDPGGVFSLAVYNCLKPVICAVNGPAVGFGATLQLPADFRLASINARFGFVFSRRGVVPEACSNWFLPRIVGIAKSLDWSITGRVFEAKEALEAGLVKGIYEPNDLLPAARELARDIIQNTSAISVALIRQMQWRMLGADHPMQAHEIETKGFFALGMTGEAREGILSFLEKRPPHFPGKVSKDMPAFFPWWDEKA